MKNSRYVAENRQLKHQLEIARLELATIKGSRAFNVARMLSAAKTELTQSPVGFGKKVARKLLAGGDPRKSLGNAGHRLSTAATIASQYETWITLSEPDEVELALQAQRSANFASQPLISIITPVFNPPKDVFVDLVESVLAQSYPRFELCLGNFGDDPEIAAVIDEYARSDDRIKDLRFSGNEGIAANSNQILKKINGDYIALLDHDDTLSPDALYENVKRINETDADFIFSDKDKIDEVGKRFDPFFKPGWAPDMMLNVNYLTHLNVMRTSVVKEVGGWSSDTDGAQDWDLFLKIMNSTSKIEHIPKVLYHWRVIATSTAMSIETKPYALAGQRVAVDRYMQTHKLPGESYHVGAELLIKWTHQKESAAWYVISSSPNQTRQFLRHLPDKRRENCVIVTDYINSSRSLGTNLLEVDSDAALKGLAARVSKQTEKLVLVVSDKLAPNEITPELIHELSGWLTIEDVVAAAPRVIDSSSGRAVDTGAIMTPEGLAPTFNRPAPYQQDPGGNVEWIRDVAIGSGLCVVAHQTDVARLTAEADLGSLIPSLQLALAGDRRRVIFDPKMTISLAPQATFEAEVAYDMVTDEIITQAGWPYYNPNLDPANLAAIQAVAQTTLETDYDEGISPYSLEAMAHAANYVVDDIDIESNRQHIVVTAKSRLDATSSSIMMILPGFTGIYAGLNNIFSFADRARERGSAVTFALMVEPTDLAEHRRLIEAKFPELGKAASFVTASMANAAELPRVDIAICTQWATAYILLKYNKSNRKCYFIQDKESSFYPKGTISALVDNTYEFGYYALANTPGLLEWYKHEYSGTGVTVKSKVYLDVYAPSTELHIEPPKPYKVFFYARPGEPRNAFELGAEALRLLKRKYKHNVEIYAAGATWDPGAYGLEGDITCLGKISYDTLPSFYRSMDVGLMFMFSGHPGVVASELMASGCPVVVNRYDDDTWRELYNHEESAVVSLPTAKAVFEALDRALTDAPLRRHLIPTALKTVAEFYTDYTDSCDQALATLKNPIRYQS